jgi:hypothetical protein
MNLCIIGSAQHWNKDSFNACKELAERLGKGFKGKFVTGGERGGPPCSFVHSLPEKRQKDVIFMVPLNVANWKIGEKDEIEGALTLLNGETDEERQECLAEFGDVFIMIEGGPGAQREAQLALDAGKQVFVLPFGSPYAEEIEKKVGKCNINTICRNLTI